MKTQSVKLDQICHLVDTQSRVALDSNACDDYAERMAAGDKFPPVVIFQDDSIKGAPNMFLADGFHRVWAANKNGFKDILAEVHKGTMLDALKHSIGANRTNGVCRTNADKRKCVHLALEHFSNLSDRAIAEMVGVGAPFVGDCRRAASAAPVIGLQVTSERTGRDGKTYTMPQRKAADPAPPAEAPKLDADEFATPEAKPEDEKPRVQAEPQEFAAVRALLPRVPEAYRLRVMQEAWAVLSPVDRTTFLAWADKPLPADVGANAPDSGKEDPPSPASASARL